MWAGRRATQPPTTFSHLSRPSPYQLRRHFRRLVIGAELVGQAGVGYTQTSPSTCGLSAFHVGMEARWRRAAIQSHAERLWRAAPSGQKRLDRLAREWRPAISVRSWRPSPLVPRRRASAASSAATWPPWIQRNRNTVSIRMKSTPAIPTGRRSARDRCPSSRRMIRREARMFTTGDTDTLVVGPRAPTAKSRLGGIRARRPHRHCFASAWPRRCDLARHAGDAVVRQADGLDFKVLVARCRRRHR